MLVGWGRGKHRGPALFASSATLAAYALLALGGGAVSGASMAATSATGTTISTRSTTLGLIVVGVSKRTVYLFTKDGNKTSKCGSTCRKTWVPVGTAAKPKAGAGIKQSKLSETTAHQVTYYGHPLYYYTGDHKTAGHTKGQGLSSFNGRWWVVSPQGKAGTGVTIRMHATGDGSAVAGPLGNGRTVYHLTSDSTTKSTCSGDCANTWPPLVTTGKPRAGAGTSAGLIGTLVRGNGTRQVTYNGHPLYYYSGDSVAGDDNGECLAQSATAHWYILNAAGKPIKNGASSSCTTGSPSGACPEPPATPAYAHIDVAAHPKGSLSGILVDGRGCTMYQRTSDVGGTPGCTSVGSCTSTWPPVLSTYAPVAGSGVTCTLGRVANGSTQGQVTCAGHPLYFYVPDTKVSDACGQGTASIWYAVKPDGAQASGAASCP